MGAPIDRGNSDGTYRVSHAPGEVSQPRGDAYSIGRKAHWWRTDRAFAPFGLLDVLGALPWQTIS